MNPASRSAPDRSVLHAFVAVVAIGGLVGAGAVLSLPVGPRPRLDTALVVLGLATLCAEAFPVLVIRRHGSELFDVSSTFTLAAVVTVGPASAIAIQALSRTVVELASGRPPVKAAFNVGQRVLTLVAAGLAARAVHAGPLLDRHGVAADGALAFLAAAAAYIVVNGVLVTVVCALAAREPVIGFLRRELLRNGTSETFAALLAPVAAAVLIVEPLLVPLLAVPAWALWRSGRQATASYHQARQDALTGLPNRVKLRENVDTRFAHLSAKRMPFAFVVMDLDRFKEVNDTLGHDQGDRLLAAVAFRLAEHAPEGSLLGRLQGDEFGLLLEGDATDALAWASELTESFHAPLVVDDLSLEIGISAGVALAAPDVESVDELLRRADVAMHVAKAFYTGVALYREAEDHFSPARLKLMGGLRRALHDGEVQPFFQPQVDLRTGRVVGAEALLRWVRPDGTQVPPADFVAHAENTGVIKPLTMHVLDRALSAQRRWATEGMPLRVAVNLSARSLLDPDLVADIRHALERAKVPAPALDLEVTESAVMSDPERASRTLERLHALGVHLSIDDFGTGHSSLAYLSRLPVDTVKIDRSFVSRVVSDGAAELIVRMTVDLGHDLGLAVVAEGVEDQQTRDRLTELGCDLGQGFLWSPAVPAERLEATVRGLPRLRSRSAN